MRRRGRRAERVLILLFLFLSLVVLWWETSQRNRVVASLSHSETLRTTQGTVIALTTTEQSIRLHHKSQWMDDAATQEASTELFNQEADAALGLRQEISHAPDALTVFDGNIEDLFVAPYRLIETNETEGVRERLCRIQSSKCQKFGLFSKMLHRGTSSDASSRLNILLADPLAWLMQKYSELAVDVTQKLADRLNADRSYITYKGSDHVIVCLSESCYQWAEAFSSSLAGNQGSRAIYAGINVDRDRLKWPCPHRVIDLDSKDLKNIKVFIERILKVATLMIENRNRWICSDAHHPSSHFGEHNQSMGHGGIYYNAYGLLMCQIPESGNVELIEGLKRMKGRDWNKAGIRYLNVENNFTMTKEIYDNTSVVKAAVVRHPFPRLLAAYSDKIFKKKEYNRLPGLEEYVAQHGVPSFESFVDFLIAHNPDPYDPNLDPHFSIQSSMCGLKDHKFDFVGSVSDLDREFKEFALSLDSGDPTDGYRLEADLLGSPKFRLFNARIQEIDRRVSVSYTRAMAMKVYEYYKDDFVRFGFTAEAIDPST